MLTEGRLIQMFTMAISIFMTYYVMEQIKKGKKISLRPIPALDAIDEVVGRSAEMNRPVHFTPGFTLGGIYNSQHGPQVMAGLSVLKRVAESCAKRGASLIVTLNQAEIIPVAEDSVKTAYATQNLIPPSNTVRFISTEQYAYVAGVLSILLEERPAANILMGYFWSESLQFAEGGAYIGAMQIGGTASLSQVPFFVASCDYFLFGEELFAARAYVEQDPALIGSLRGQDYLRLIMISLTAMIFLAGNFQLPWLIEMLMR